MVEAQSSGIDNEQALREVLQKALTTLKKREKAATERGTEEQEGKLSQILYCI